MRWLGRFPLVAVAFLVLGGCSRSGNPALSGIRADEVDYNWHVRPILSENCFKCHGPDPASREAGLRLDLRDVAVAELPETPGKHAIVPGNADRSELVRRIRATNVDERMPPESTHKTLSPQQMAILEQWIENGAEYQPHWAFIAPAAADGPGRHERGRRERDRPLRSRAARPRRLEAFRRGRQGDADQSRHADADGPAADARRSRRVRRRHGTRRLRTAHRPAARLDARTPSTWRATGSTSPASARRTAFSTTTTTGCCGRGATGSSTRSRATGRSTSSARGRSPATCSPNATREQILATAYLRVGKRTTENGAIDAEYKAEYMAERTDNALGVALLGLTVGCARCHDHKYDPITQADYYSLGAFFNSNDEPGAYAPGFSGIQGGPTLPWPDDATAAALRSATAEVRAKTDAYAAVRTAAADPARAGATSLASSPSRRSDPHPQHAGRRARRALRVRVGTTGTDHGSAAAAPAAHSARGVNGVPPQSVLRAAPFAERDGRATPTARGVRAPGACAAQLQRRVADAFARHDTRRRAGRHPRAAVPRRGARQRIVLRRDEPRLHGPRRRLLRPTSIRSRSIFGSTSARRTTTFPSSIIWRSRTRAAPATASRSRRAAFGRRSRTPRPRT